MMQGVKRGCWIALWAIGAYALACLGVKCGAEFSFRLLANVTMPQWVVEHVKLLAELARGLLPYIAGSVVLVMGLGAYLPGTRVAKPGRTPSQ